MPFKKTLLLILIGYLVLLTNWEFQFTGSEFTRNLKYHGLIWVALDHWSIWRYQSLDQPMSIVQYSKFKNRLTKE